MPSATLPCWQVGLVAWVVSPVWRVAAMAISKLPRTGGEDHNRSQKCAPSLKACVICPCRPQGRLGATQQCYHLFVAHVRLIAAKTVSKTKHQHSVTALALTLGPGSTDAK